MLEIFEFIFENRNKPLGYIVLAALVFIADRLVRKLITSQVKRLFNVNEKHELAAYEARQIHIEKMVEQLLKREGIEECDIKPTAVLEKKSTQPNLTRLLIWCLELIKRRIKRMGNINKGTLLMLLSAIANFLKTVYGYEIPGEQLDFYAELILWIFTIAGVVMNFTKKKKDAPITEDKEAYYH